MIYQNDEELQAACAEWQKRLRLQDWIVNPKIVRARDMKLDGACAECDPVLTRKLADIRIRDPLDYPDTDPVFNQDMEWDLVHELIHLHFFPFTTDDLNNVAVEQAVDLLANSIVNLHREAVTHEEASKEAES